MQKAIFKLSVCEELWPPIKISKQNILLCIHCPVLHFFLAPWSSGGHGSGSLLDCIPAAWILL